MREQVHGYFFAEQRSDVRYKFETTTVCKMQHWWYDRTGPRVDDTLVAETVATEIIGEILADLQKKHPQLCYERKDNRYVFRDQTAFTAITILAERDEYFCVLIQHRWADPDEIDIRQSSDWDRLPELIEQLLQDDGAYQRRCAAAREAELLAEISALQDLIHDLLPPALRAPLPTAPVARSPLDPLAIWRHTQQNLVAAHRALAPGGEAVAAVAQHFAQL